MLTARLTEAAIYGVFAAAMRDRVLASPNIKALGIMTWMRRAFVALGAKLALTQR